MEKFSLDAEELYKYDDVDKAAYENFGISYMFPWQRLVVANILEAYKYHTLVEGLSGEEKRKFDAENEDSFCKGRQIVLLPTGAGKSLCFQLPALLLDGPTLVIYPLLALMSDQKRRMEDGNLKCVIFRGGQSNEEREESFREIQNGAKIILANPEVLENEELMNRLAQVGIKHVAIDESHIVSEWGLTFRKSYLDLGKMIKVINPPIVTAFTATASPEVLKNVAEILFDGEAHIVRSESDRKNIHYYVRYAAAKKKEALRLVQTELHPMIIFCGTRNKSQDMAQEINVCFGSGTAKFYHAGLEKEEKEEIEKWFFESKDGVLCATCAYGMGVDKKDIKTVVHLETPTTAEAYIQEAGRGGRDGSVAKAILIWSPKDSVAFSKYGPESREIALKEFAETLDCRRQVLLDALGGEQAYCSGCDVCNARVEKELEMKKLDKLPVVLKKIHKLKTYCIGARNKINKSDYDYAYSLIRKYPNYYSEDEIEEEVFEYMNGKSFKTFGKNIWTHSDCADIVYSLLESKKIEKCGFLWKNKLKVSKSCV